MKSIVKLTTEVESGSCHCCFCRSSISCSQSTDRSLWFSALLNWQNVWHLRKRESEGRCQFELDQCLEEDGETVIHWLRSSKNNNSKMTVRKKTIWYISTHQQQQQWPSRQCSNQASQTDTNTRWQMTTRWWSFNYCYREQSNIQQ